MTLGAAHLELLQQLVDLPQSKRITTATVPQGCKELEAAGYVRIVPVNLSDLLTEVTDAGRRALAEAKGQSPAVSDEAALPDIPETDGEPYDGAPV